MKKYSTILILLALSLGLAPLQSFASEKTTTTCNCYDTPTVAVENFVDENKGVINPLTTSCKDDFFVTEVTQTPEKNPQESGQFLIISSVRCCQMCVN